VKLGAGELTLVMPSHKITFLSFFFFLNETTFFLLLFIFVLVLLYLLFSFGEKSHLSFPCLKHVASMQFGNDENPVKQLVHSRCPKSNHVPYLTSGLL
jgi:hypothetical protein